MFYLGCPIFIELLDIIDLYYLLILQKNLTLLLLEKLFCE